MASARILVVEDEFLIRLTLVEALSDAGFAVLEAGSGDEAVTLIQPTDPLALLITDMQLPGTLDGLALLERLRSTRPELRGIFVTGGPDPVPRSSASGSVLFIAKPCLPSEVCAAARRLVTAT